ncbi:DUF3024 domain-containing protein [Rubrivivax rivuli]|uniref:DUF3024 domain-containing protein n=1 Tax=Rubrivivax rivuli TaxID=1862385 RepID=A0A437RK76_9BURK|nr:DUF3024 domain-containing protein [Rubrivivax rivuli]RVU47062.1 DUF3024 domain-containing protein [Rubrivivax rivuli]
MAFNDFETSINQNALDWFMEQRRPPEHIRPQLDLSYEISGHTIDLFHVCPDRKDKSKLRHEPVARIKFVRTEEHWRLYWMRGDLKWYAYDPVHLHSTLQSALKVVNADELCCFFG